MIEKRFVDLYAHNSRVGRDKAERDVVLSYVLKVLKDSGLEKNLAFKGGTCLRKTLFEKTGRFSMDLDFTFLGENYQKLARSIRDVFNDRRYYDITFDIESEKKEEKGEVVSYRCDLEYSHSWNSASAKLEISLREKPVLPLVNVMLRSESYWKDLEFQPFEVSCLKSEELLAEKIRASFERTRARDLFDLYLFTGLSYRREVAKRLVVEKTWNSRTIFDPDRFLARFESEEYDWDDLESLVPQNRLPNRHALIKTVVSNYRYLRDLDDSLIRIIKDAPKHGLGTEVSRLRQTVRSAF